MRKRERLAGSKAYRLRFEAEKPKPLSKLRHTESAADALSDLLADAVIPADETEEEENVGVQAARTGRQGAESSTRRMSKQRQKKQIQRQYAAAQTGRQAEGIVVQGAGEAVFTPVQRTERKIEGFIRKNRGKLVILLLAVMMTYMLSSLSGCMPIAQSLLESLVIGTYPAEEDDLIAAERAYCGMEDALQDELDRYGEIHPGYDEVQVEQMEIWHDPYALLALVSARIGGEWTVDTAMPTLELLFEQQYKLTIAVEKETRYRTEWKKEYEQVEDPKTGEMKWQENWVQMEVAYTYTICKVKLVNKILSHLPFIVLSRERSACTRCIWRRWAIIRICSRASRTHRSSRSRWNTKSRRHTSRLTPSLPSSSRWANGISAIPTSGAATARKRRLTVRASFRGYSKSRACGTSAGWARRAYTACVRRLSRKKPVRAT